MPQTKTAIHGYVRPDVHDRFETYRRTIGLTSGSALLTLLIIREIRLKRLGGPTVTNGAGGPRGAKVSAYLDDKSASTFRGLVGTLGRSVSDCAADLIERELSERWLEAALSTSLR